MISHVAGHQARTPGWWHGSARACQAEKDIKWRSDHNMQRSNIYKHQHILPVSLQPTRAQAGAYRPGHGQSGHSSSLLSPAPAQLIRARLYSAFGNIKNQTPRHPYRPSDRGERTVQRRGVSVRSACSRVYKKSGSPVESWILLYFDILQHPGSGPGPAIFSIGGWMKVPGKKLRMCENL